VIKRTMIALTVILLAACGGSLATTTPHPTVGPTDVTLSLTVEAIRAGPQETSEAIVSNARDATYEAEGIQDQAELDRQAYADLIIECARDVYRRTPPYLQATATAKALSCAARTIAYQSKFATQTSVAAIPTPRP